MISLKIRFGKKQNAIYKTLYKLPVYNWMKCRINKDFSYLYEDESLHGKPLEEEQVLNINDIYLGMITEFFNEFGQTKSFKNEIKLKSEIIDLNIEFIKTGDKFLLNAIKMLNIDLEKMSVKNVEEDLNVNYKKELAKLGESMGIFVNTKTVNVIDYYTQLIGSSNG